MKNENTKKKTLKLILLLLIFIILFLTISSTYSKYITKTENKADMNISNWYIEVNDQDISQTADFSEYLTLIYEPNEHIAENVIVPTSNASFEVTLNSTKTDIPFSYEFTLGDYLNADIPDFKIIALSINDGEKIDIGPTTTPTEVQITDSEKIILDYTNENTIITGTINPSEDNSDVINKFKFWVKWYDETDNILDNFNDVSVSKLEVQEGNTRPTTNFPVKLKVTQLLVEPEPMP